jgi:hypothetical protein
VRDRSRPFRRRRKGQEFAPDPRSRGLAPYHRCAGRWAHLTPGDANMRTRPYSSPLTAKPQGVGVRMVRVQPFSSARKAGRAANDNATTSTARRRGDAGQSSASDVARPS